jgi:hypothetical protein
MVWQHHYDGDSSGVVVDHFRADGDRSGVVVDHFRAV